MPLGHKARQAPQGESVRQGRAVRLDHRGRPDRSSRQVRLPALSEQTAVQPVNVIALPDCGYYQLQFIPGRED
jgi:hypothetical protein